MLYVVIRRVSPVFSRGPSSQILDKEGEWNNMKIDEG